MPCVLNCCGISSVWKEEGRVERLFNPTFLSFFLLKLFLLVGFKTGSLCSHGCPGVWCVDRAGHKLIPWMLRQPCTHCNHYRTEQQLDKQWVHWLFRGAWWGPTSRAWAPAHSCIILCPSSIDDSSGSSLPLNPSHQSDSFLFLSSCPLLYNLEEDPLEFCWFQLSWHVSGLVTFRVLLFFSRKCLWSEKQATEHLKYM